MCGIFGIAGVRSLGLGYRDFEKLLAHLFHISEVRGKEAMGLAIVVQDDEDDDVVFTKIFKSSGRASKIITQGSYKEFLNNAWKSGRVLSCFGHSRLVTNGWRYDNVNNHPVITDISAGIHNGIIVNQDEIKSGFPEINLESDLDSELLFKVIDQFINESGNGNPDHAIKRAYELIEGVANVAFVTKKFPGIHLATNNGSIHYAHTDGATAFASEKFILQQALRHKFLNQPFLGSEVKKLANGTSVLVEFSGAVGKPINFVESACNAEESGAASSSRKVIVDIDYQPKTLVSLKRCTRCLLPESFPAISFDASGVCSVCQNYDFKKTQGREALLKIVEPHRGRNGEIDCIVAFSGGRDSSYGLHYIKNELGLNPVAYTYDWGMVTDIARRNQSRLCAKMGIEHIIRSPDIPAKRRYIRKNIEAWLKKPDLGMIPLLMAGDKQYYHFSREVQKEFNLNLVFHCAGNELERTEFKSGFCGIKEPKHGQVFWKYSIKNKLDLALYYLNQYIRNPAYLNESLIDTIHAYYSTFIARDDFQYLYHYIQWDEKIITETLSDVYGWEIAKDTTNTWRIGDGTAAFYNYVYHTIAGFSEHDTFRSNQIRAGLISREQGLALVEEDNLPRWDAMREYAELIGFSLEEAVQIINTVAKRY